MTEIISVRFREGCRNYDFDPKGVQVEPGQRVIVETPQGPDLATCTEGNHEVEDAALVKPLSAVIRVATDSDLRAAEYNHAREEEAFHICEQKIAKHGLEMKLVKVAFSFDGNKITFYFTADGRVDFRSLVRDLASVFRARIELRQIGVRDEAKMIGGLGICGRPFCCSQFLDSFLPVSIKMAKTQNLSLNPTKISGTCGRLMCCLKYEQNAYEDAVKRLPKVESFVQTPDGPGNVKGVDLLRETVKVSLDSAPEPLRCYHNCEICLLRNGKGSREGIEIPERPTRFVEETARESREESLFSPPFYMDAEEDVDIQRESASERPRRNSHRGKSVPHGSRTDGKRPKSSGKRGERSGKSSKQGQPPRSRADRPEGGGKKDDSKRRRPYYRRRRNNGD